MQVSIKIRNSIISRLDKIKHKIFIEDDIKLLLIDIRESIREETLLRELADFVAHPIRHKGIFNKALNTRYFKFKLISEQQKKLSTDQQKEIKTEKKLSDFLLAGIDIHIIAKKLFEVLFIDGLNDIDEKVFKDHYPLTKKQIQRLVSSSYQLDDKKQFYTLKNAKSQALVIDALKFIRGTIQAKAVFNQETFEKEILKALSRIINELNLDQSYLKEVKANLKSILLCILCLLHDSKFVFHDNHIGTCFLSLYPSSSKSLTDKPDMESLIALISDDIGISMPIFISNIKIGAHLNKVILDEMNFMERIPWFSLKRNISNKLILTS